MDVKNTQAFYGNIKAGLKSTPMGAKNNLGGVSSDIYNTQNENQVQLDDFLQLMIQQLSNQDFMNPVDDTQYLTQMATFATMQQMEQLAYYSKSNYAMSLAGKEVTVARLGTGGEIEKFTGPVDRIIFVDNEYKIFVKGEEFQLNQIMEVHGSSTEKEKPDIPPTALYTIGIKGKTSDSVNISWETPDIPGQDSSKFKYSVYYSTDPIFNTVKDVKKGTLVGDADTQNINSIKVEGLDPNTTYYFNVVMEDENGVESVYSKGIATTLTK